MDDKKDIMKDLCKLFEDKLEELKNDGYRQENSDYWFKTMDNYKDVFEIKKLKEDLDMRYGRRYSEGGYQGPNYGNENYGNENYGRRYGTQGIDAKYQGENYLDNMYQGFREYSESGEAYSRGNYGAKDDSIEALEYMLKQAVNFFKMLKEDAKDEESMQIIRKYAKKISEM